MTRLPDTALPRLREVVADVDFEHPRYRLGELLGRGGMGSVYRAWDAELEREVALKLLDPVFSTPEAEERLRREARILARLEHPGVVPVHDAGHLPDGRVFCVMKRIDGRRLDDAAFAAAPLNDRLRIFERICDTVAFAHARGVIHRDLKPSNVMVGAYGEVLVLDWGIARVLAEPDALAGAVAGTHGFMAPEQAAGRGDATDARSDVHALGALLEDLLTRGGPEAPDGAPLRRLIAVTRKARARDPGERYPDVAALAADVARFRAGERVLACPESAWERLERIAYRYRLPLALIGAYLTMRLLLLFWERR